MKDADTSAWTPLNAVARYAVVVVVVAGERGREVERSRGREVESDINRHTNACPSPKTAYSLFHGWTVGERPPSGSLAQVITKNSETNVVLE